MCELCRKVFSHKHLKTCVIHFRARTNVVIQGVMCKQKKQLRSLSCDDDDCAGDLYGTTGDGTALKVDVTVFFSSRGVCVAESCFVSNGGIGGVSSEVLV